MPKSKCSALHNQSRYCTCNGHRSRISETLGHVHRNPQLRAFAEFFDLVLSQAPGVFDGLCSGHSLTSDDDITVVFEDSRSLETELVPADALYALATAALEEGGVAAVYQVLTMAGLTRVALSQACIRALV